MADNEVARAVVTIVPSMAGAQQTITNELTSVAASPGVASAGNKAGSSFGKALGTGLKVAGAATAAVTAVAAKSADAFIDAAGEVAAYGDNIDKMSQKVGISAEAYQEWDFIAQHSGTSMESLKTSFKTLSNAAQDGNDAFEKLGISLEDAASMSTEDLFSAVITGLQGMEEGTERTAIASDLLGRGATELGALLNTSAEDTEAMREQIHELGGVMSDEAVKSAAAYQDSLQNLQTGFAGLKNNLMSDFLPGITAVMDGLTAVISGDSEGGLASIGQGIDDLISNLTNAAPQMFEVAAGIISSLGQAIMDNLPTLLQAGLPIIMELVQGIIENLPALFETGLQMLLMIAQAIGDNLPTLIPAAVEAIVTIAEGLIDNIDLLIDAAIAIILGLAEGLIDALPKLIEKLPEIIEKIVSALIENAPKLVEASLELIIALAGGLIEAIPELIKAIPKIIVALVDGLKEAGEKMLDVGKDIVNGIWEGIKGAWDDMVSNVKSKVNGLVDSVKGALKIGSPSRVFADEVGKWIPEGIAVGITANADSVTESMDELMRGSMLSSAVAINAVPSTFSMGNVGSISGGSTSNDVLRILAQYLPEIASSIGKPINVNQNNRGMFSAVREENVKFVSATGYHALA